jgi:hypothetical protein
MRANFDGKKNQQQNELNSDPLHLKFTQTSITVTFKKMIIYYQL